MLLSEKTLQFLQELAANNDRNWFLEHKNVYEKDVKLPFQSLITQFIEALGMPITYKESIFRLNRDTRFSHDKTPYKTHISAVVSRYGTKDKAYPGHYLHIDGETCMIGGGAYFLEKEPLKNVRNAIVNDHSHFQEIITEPGFLKHFGGLHDSEKNKIIPAEYKEFFKIEPLIANKQFFVMKSYPATIATKADFLDVLLSHAKALGPLNSFLQEGLKS
jgi:uncharacterized protein (TIGR02453 family)